MAEKKGVSVWELLSRGSYLGLWFYKCLLCGEQLKQYSYVKHFKELHKFTGLPKIDVDYIQCLAWPVL